MRFPFAPEVRRSASAAGASQAVSRLPKAPAKPAAAWTPPSTPASSSCQGRSRRTSVVGGRSSPIFSEGTEAKPGPLRLQLRLRLRRRRAKRGPIRLRLRLRLRTARAARPDPTPTPTPSPKGPRAGVDEVQLAGRSPRRPTARAKRGSAEGAVNPAGRAPLRPSLTVAICPFGFVLLLAPGSGHVTVNRPAARTPRLGPRCASP